MLENKPSFESIHEHVRDVYIRSSDKNRNFIIAFITLEIFIFLAVANTTDINFLIPDIKICLPLINVTVNIFTFYIAAPVLIFVFHLTLLFNISQHAIKVQDWNEFIQKNKLESKKTSLLSHFFYNYQYSNMPSFIKMWLVLINFVIIVLSAPALLIYMWITFGAYHQLWVSSLHLFLGAFQKRG